MGAAGHRRPRPAMSNVRVSAIVSRLTPLQEGDSVATVEDHYERHLAPVYLWMAGGFADAIARGEKDLDAIPCETTKNLTAVDLGAGFGLHAIPLARRGYQVLAVDSSALLLEELQNHANGLPIVSVVGDLLSFPQHLKTRADLILCMGDTLTHLKHADDVLRLFSLAAEWLAPTGTFVATLRDYASPLLGPARFIPVRSDEHRIHTCFLEYQSDIVMVHDILHERVDSTWRQRVSAYPKLRLSPEWITQSLKQCGFSVRVEAAFNGMLRVVALR